MATSPSDDARRLDEAWHEYQLRSIQNPNEGLSREAAFMAGAKFGLAEVERLQEALEHITSYLELRQHSYPKSVLARWVIDRARRALNPIPASVEAAE